MHMTSPLIMHVIIWDFRPGILAGNFLFLRLLIGVNIFPANVGQTLLYDDTHSSIAYSSSPSPGA